MAVVYTYVGILTVDVVFFWSPGIFHSQDSFPSTVRPRLWETSSGVVASHCSELTYSDHSWRYLPQLGTKRRGKGILRMEDAGTSEEDDINSQDSNTPIDHGHLAWNCSIKIKLNNWLLRNPEVHYHLYMRLPLDPILNKIYPVSSIITHRPQVHFNIILPSMLWPP